MEKIGLFGGTFNPIHVAHLRSALEVKESFGLNRIVMIPAAIPPHKQQDQVIAAEDRLHMIRLAVADAPEFCISDVELTRRGPSFTIDTVMHFKATEDPDAELFFILGSDAFFELDTWKSHRDLLSAIPFIVMVRPDPPDPDAGSLHERIQGFLEKRISPAYSFRAVENGYFHPEFPPVYIQRVTPMAISSTWIRGQVERHRSIRYLVPSDVERFIMTKGLYQ